MSYVWYTGTQLRPFILRVAHCHTAKSLYLAVSHWHMAKTLYFGSMDWKLHSLRVVPGLPYLWNYGGWKKLGYVVLEGKAESLLKYLLAVRLPSMVILTEPFRLSASAHLSFSWALGQYSFSLTSGNVAARVTNTRSCQTETEHLGRKNPMQCLVLGHSTPF